MNGRYRRILAGTFAGLRSAFFACFNVARVRDLVTLPPSA